MHSFFAKKIAKKVIRDTWASITYCLGKYHVLLGQVSRDTLQSIISLKKCHRWTDFLGYHRFCRTRIALRTRMWSLPRLCCMSFLRTRIANETNVEPTSSLLYELFKNTNSSNDTNVEPTSALLYELFKNTNSSNDTNVEPNSALLFEFF